MGTSVRAVAEQRNVLGRAVRGRWDETRAALSTEDVTALVELDSEANRRLMMMLFGGLCFGSAVIGTILLLPYTSRLGLSFESSLLRGVAAAALGLVALAMPGRIPMAAVDAVVVGATGFICVAVAASPQPLAGYLVLFYFWPMLALVVLRSERAALAHFVFIAVISGATFALDDTFENRLLWWGVVLIALTMVWQSTGWLVQRARTLARAERRARDRAEKASAAIAEVSEQKTSFLAAMSHELRTPLNAVIGFGQLLRRQIAGELNEDQRAYVDDIVDSGQHLLALIDDTLDDRQVETGEYRLEPELVVVRDLVDDAVRFVRDRAETAGIVVGVGVAEVGMTILDERKIRQVLVNLLSNAVKFTPPGGRVTIGARATDRGVEFSVTDTGPGIDPASHETIFDEYRQSATPATGAEGTGLGLSVARAMVELHGGTIGVTSVPGDGATFAFSVPFDLSNQLALSPATSRRVDDGPSTPTTPQLVSTDDAIGRLALSAVYVLVAVVAAALTGTRTPGLNQRVLWVVAVYIALMAGILAWARGRQDDAQLVRLGFGFTTVSIVAVGFGMFHVGVMAPAVTLVWVGLDTYVRILGEKLDLPRAAIVNCVVVGVLLAVYVGATDGNNAPALQWGIVMGTLVFSTILLGTLLDRLRFVARAEREAAEHALAVATELETVSRHKSQFLAGMSHELRTPLNAVIGFAEALQREIPGPINDRQRAYVDDIVTSGRHLLTLINDVLDLAKIDAGRLEVHVGETDLAGLVDSACRRARAHAEDKGIAWSLHAPTDVVLYADEARLAQAVSALAANAVQFTPPGGRVSVDASADDEWVTIAVIDEGPGIAADDQHAIFEPFHQGDTGPSHARDGAGLGLSLARRLVELHGGTLTVESTVGAGATFTTTVPRGLDPERGMAPGSARGRPGPRPSPSKRHASP